MRKNTEACERYAGEEQQYAIFNGLEDILWHEEETVDEGEE